MSGRIYLLNKNSELVGMDEAPYDSEKLLQELLAKHPDLLAGEQIDTEDPRRWLLVAREMSVPDEDDGGARWSLDHLFLDQEGVPTLVEVKRSSDTRIRREVVGQMLDYAANAVAYWPVEEIRAKFETRCREKGEDPDEALTALLDSEQGIDDFWQLVKTNLQAGRIRMVFLADTIPSELRRIVEFLNGQMDPAEVIAVEIKQFVGDGMRTLVPRVIGQSENARRKKSAGSGRDAHVSEIEFMEGVVADRPSNEVEVVRRLMAWARGRKLGDNFRQGQTGCAYIPKLPHADGFLYPISVRQKGAVVIQMRWLRDHPPFDRAEKRAELSKRIESIPNLRMRQAGMEGFPSFPIASLADEQRFAGFIETLDWIVDEIRATE